ncbi:MAG TPA: hypothetical protein VG406_04330 [Isosphaeraceae bacterium]|jgi:hypothetical protein|nr:hypothetical protein [Isosphaeraceae bacterium]
MTTLLDRLQLHDGRRVLGTGRVPLADVLDRLTAGARPIEVVAATSLAPRDVVAALAFAALGPRPDDGPPPTRAAPQWPTLAPSLSEPALAGIFPDAARPARLALAAGLLQAHDFWNDSHHAAQEAEDRGERAVAAYWHGVAHRREPDPANAAYWFRRVGPHPVFTPLAAGAAELLEDYSDPVPTARLLRDGRWDPFAMIDLCTGARPGTPAAALAGRLQRLELILLLDATLAPFSP